MQRDIVFVLGRTGSGKSHWAKKFLASRTRLFAFDPFGALPGVSFARDDDHLIEMYDALYERETERSFRPSLFAIGSTNPEHVDVLGAMSFERSNCTLALEELSLVFPRRQPIPPWCRDLVFLGRHRGCSLVLIAQRAASVPIELRSQATRIVTFQQTEPRDVAWLGDYYGEQADRVPELDDFYCLDYDARAPREHRVKMYKAPA
jgi:DNA helicase HerA-like ATPase